MPRSGRDDAAADAAEMPEAEIERLVELHRFEVEFWRAGHLLIGGVDEVGRGPLAGPVVAACVVVNEPLMLAKLNDSKRVAQKRREQLAKTIQASVAGWSIGSASVAEIDELNIGRAVKLAMSRAVEGLAIAPNALLVDALAIPGFAGPQTALVDGDARSAAIAAASIVAKVYRDQLLVELDKRYPHYGFARHKGYGTPAHLAALREHGPSPEHRRSFAPVRAALSRENGR